jgi:hypothetical protein
METLFLKKSPSFTNKLSRAKQNFSVTYDDIKSPDDIRCFDGIYFTDATCLEIIVMVTNLPLFTGR